MDEGEKFPLRFEPPKSEALQTLTPHMLAAAPLNTGH